VFHLCETMTAYRGAMADLLTNTSPVLRHAWNAVALSSEMPDEGPLGVWLGGEAWVLARLDGELTAFVDLCPHRLAPMSAGRVVRSPAGGDRLACGYHGWQYRPDGQCGLIPALGKTDAVSRRAALKPAFGVTERYGLIWLAPNEPLAPLTPFPQWDSATDRGMCAPVRTAAGAAQLLDNFLDAAHFPYVHADTFGVESGPLGGGEVQTDGLSVTASFQTDYRENGVVTSHTVTKTAGPCTTVHLTLELPAATMGILMCCVPETATTTRVIKLVTRDDVNGDPGRWEEFVKSEDRITAEDVAILERFVSAGLPLDPRVEMHTRSDRLSLAWRTVMAKAVAQVGS